MKNNKNLRTICLSLMAMALIIALNVGNALAYFTTYTTAKGGITLNLEFSYAEIIEEVNPEAGWKKIEVKNIDPEPDNPDINSADCYVRIKAFAASERNIQYSGSATDKTAAVTGWTLKNGYCEYDKILKPGETTNEPIYVHFDVPTDGTSYNVIVIQECTPVLHDNAGNVLPADWDTVTNDPTTFVGTTN